MSHKKSNKEQESKKAAERTLEEIKGAKNSPAPKSGAAKEQTPHKKK